jgi:2-polyprenyl-3-methyl-5-hydroxy-6-metoxy-1,4-benzoquinol methylase
MEARTKFWNRKIQGWEAKRYDKANSPIALRADFARQILNQSAQGQNIIDLGCGTGTLFRGLNAADFKSLHGVDFSPTAIELARQQQWAPNVSFSLQNASEVDLRSADFVVGLVLLDWLTEAQIALLLNRLSGRHFLLSFSNSSAWRLALLHAVFVQLTYGWRTSGYRPRYFHAQELLFHFNEQDVKDVRFTTLPEHPLVGFLMST